MGDGGSSLPFKLERLGNDADRQRAEILGNFCYDWGRSGTGATPHSCSDEDKVGAVKRLAEVL